MGVDLDARVGLVATIVQLHLVTCMCPASHGDEDAALFIAISTPSRAFFFPAIQ